MAGNNEKIGGGGFHHLAMKVGNFEESVKFYTEGLGFKKSLTWGEGDSRAIMLDAGDGNFFEIFAGGSKGQKPEGAFTHAALRTDNCDLAVKNAVNAGAEVTVEPNDVMLQSEPPTPLRIAFCKGPDGELIEFFQYR
jgi:glyoxylase I family protein